jgi:hypothetical protein
VETLRSVDGADVGAQESDQLLEAATRLGFALVSYHTDSGQTIWEWRLGDGPRPQFVTERVARQWMADWIEQSAPSSPDVLAERRRLRTTETAPPPAPHVVAESA